MNEITREDYPWVNALMTPLRGRVTVPCPDMEILQLWQEHGTVATLQRSVGEPGTTLVKLPPQHLDEGPRGLLQDLEGLGVIQRLHNGRIQMPDVHRIAFGLGAEGASGR